MSKSVNSSNKIDINGEIGFGIIIALILLAIAFVWGNYDKKSQVLSPELKDLLSDDDNTNALLSAIEEEKDGKNKSQEFIMGGKKYKLKRSGKESLLNA